MAAPTRPVRGVRLATQQEKKKGRPWWYWALMMTIFASLALLVWGGRSVWFALTHVRASSAKVAGLVVNIAAKSDTRVQQILVHTGDEVSKGQIMAILDKMDLQADVERTKAILSAQRSERERAERELELTIRETSASIEEAEAQLAAARARLRQSEAEWQLESRQQPEEVRRAVADLSSAQSKLRDAEASLKRMEKLFSEGAVSQQQLDNARTTVQVAQAAMESVQAALDVAKAQDYQSRIRQQAVATREAETQQAQAGVRSAETQTHRVSLAEQQVLSRRAAVAEAEADVSAAEARLSDAVLRSPINGILIKGPGRSVKDGEVVTKGEPIVTILAKDIPYWISASVSELYAGRVKEGQPVLIRIDSLDTGWFGRKWIHGTVDKVGAATEFQSTDQSPWMTQQIPIKVTFNATGLPVKPGATCRLWVDVRK